MPLSPVRSRRDRCPGVLRPWPADDGALVRVRLPGGQVSAAALRGLSEVARTYGDGALHLTGRANLQLRGLPGGDVLPGELVAAIEATGLLPSRRHDLARNLMGSPLTGRHGGRADLRPVLAELDRLLLDDPALGDLPGRFLLVLDDGRGDLVDRETDLGAVALDESTAQLRVGAGWGEVVPLSRVAASVVDLARRFLRVRGEGPTAAWHVEELAEPLVAAVPGDVRLPAACGPLPHGSHGDHDHVVVPDGVLMPSLVDALTASGDDLVVTPWHGVVVAR